MFFLWSRYVADIPYIYHHLPHHCHYSEPGLPQVITLVLLVSSSLLQDWWAYLKIGHSQFQRTIICLSFYSYHNHKNLLKCNLGGFTVSPHACTKPGCQKLPEVKFLLELRFCKTIAGRHHHNNRGFRGNNQRGKKWVKKGAAWMHQIS